MAYKEKVGEQMQDILGTRGQIPTKTFLAAHDRGVALQCKHFMEVSLCIVFKCFKKLGVFKKHDIILLFKNKFY